MRCTRRTCCLAAWPLGVNLMWKLWPCAANGNLVWYRTTTCASRTFLLTVTIIIYVLGFPITTAYRVHKFTAGADKLSKRVLIRVRRRLTQRAFYPLLFANNKIHYWWMRYYYMVVVLTLSLTWVLDTNVPPDGVGMVYGWVRFTLSTIVLVGYIVLLLMLVFSVFPRSIARL